MTYTHPPKVEDYAQFLTEHGVDPVKVPALAADFADYCTGVDSAYAYQDDVDNALRSLREYPTTSAVVVKLSQVEKMLRVSNPDNPTYTLRIYDVDTLTTTDQAAAVAAYNEAEPQSYLLTRPELREGNRPPRKEGVLLRVADELRKTQ